jgi:hypothetical protein
LRNVPPAVRGDDHALASLNERIMTERGARLQTTMTLSAPTG